VSRFRRRDRNAESVDTDASVDETEEVYDDGAPAAAPSDRASGPWDVSEVDDPAANGRVNMGGMWIPMVDGLEVRVEADQETAQVLAVTLVLDDGALQLQPFAAPRNEGIWDEIRAEIAESILDQGGTADEVRGPLGTELRTRMPSAGPDGRTVFAPARFAGVDGPRWFLRAVFSGRAAIDDEAAAPLLDVVRDAVVVRGDSAMAPREMLPLTLPAQPDAAAPEHDHDGDEGPTGVRADDLKPFERGPEITEVR
jgi:hypothetical protein